VQLVVISMTQEEVISIITLQLLVHKLLPLIVVKEWLNTSLLVAVVEAVEPPLVVLMVVAVVALVVSLRVQYIVNQDQILL
tara:strand:+ start:74 stop:316 length:243 start_codon:yes stop_codon:yes gene_type:complete